MSRKVKFRMIFGGFAYTIPKKRKKEFGNESI